MVGPRNLNSRKSRKRQKFEAITLLKRNLQQFKLIFRGGTITREMRAKLKSVLLLTAVERLANVESQSRKILLLLFARFLLPSVVRAPNDRLHVQAWH